MIPLTIRTVYRQAKDPSSTSGSMLLFCAERLRSGDRGYFPCSHEGADEGFQKACQCLSGFLVCDESSPVLSLGFTNPGKVGTMVLGIDSRLCSPQPSLTHLHRSANGDVPGKQVDLKIGGGWIVQFHYYERFFASTVLESGSCASSLIAWSIFSRVSLVSASTSEAVKPLVGMGSRTSTLRSGQPCSQGSKGIK